MSGAYRPRDPLESILDARNGVRFTPLANYKERVERITDIPSLRSKEKILEKALESAQAEYTRLPPTASKFEQLRVRARMEILFTQLSLILDRVKAVLAEHPQQNGQDLDWALRFIDQHDDSQLTHAEMLQHIRKDLEQPGTQGHRGLPPAERPVSTANHIATAPRLEAEPNAHRPVMDPPSEAQRLTELVDRSKNDPDAETPKRLEAFRNTYAELHDPKSKHSPALNELRLFGHAYEVELHSFDAFVKVDEVCGINADLKYHALKTLGAAVNEFLRTGYWDKERIKENVESAVRLRSISMSDWERLESEIRLLRSPRGKPEGIQAQSNGAFSYAIS
ncbi:hypothetical protein H4CHR_05728 [Variovorax sp. PBS-H4]|nr:hypothetical protein H4CHR_05728 [Variovorax sp. PBS-H4]